MAQTDVEAMVRKDTFSEEQKQERERGLIAMKKFGLLPRDFQPDSFAAEVMGESVAGFYDPKTKTVSLLNWMPVDEQRTVLAHELTHALQDQNYDLQRWHRQREISAHGASGAIVNSDTDEGESSLARTSVTEGQAMVVLYDYLLAPYHMDLQHSPALVEPLQQQMSYVTEGPAMHRAPLVMREGMMFPYHEGLMFEIALLLDSGRQTAFAGALQHPPRLTHEILHPDAYLKHEKLPVARIPDLHSVLSDARVQDFGTIGELDTRIFIHQYESKWLADSLAKGWRGGSYATVARSAGTPASTGDVALLYVSRWDTANNAERFAKFYQGAVAKRYERAVADPNWTPTASKRGAPNWTAEVITEEGPVMIEQWGNTVIVSESFDPAAAGRLRDAVLDSSDARASLLPREDMTLRLVNSPELAGVRDAMQENVLRGSVEAIRAAVQQIR